MFIGSASADTIKTPVDNTPIMPTLRHYVQILGVPLLTTVDTKNWAVQISRYVLSALFFVPRRNDLVSNGRRTKERGRGTDRGCYVTDEDGAMVAEVLCCSAHNERFHFDHITCR